MEMRFKGILHAKKSTDTATGLTGTAQVNCPLYETDVEALFKYHPAKITLTALAGEKVVGMVKGRMSGTRTTVTKEGTFLYLNFEGVVDKDFQHLDSAVGESLDFVIEMVPEEQEQPELGDTE